MRLLEREKTKEEKKYTDSTYADRVNIFDLRSQFMYGFGIGWSLDEDPGSELWHYGCKIPESSQNSSFKSSFENIRNSVETARQEQKEDAAVDESLNMAVKFIDSLETFINILGPYGQSQLSDYCTGMVFGLESVRVLKKVATRIRDKNVMERLV